MYDSLIKKTKGIVKAGELDRKIRFEGNIAPQDGYGQPTEEDWQPIADSATVWASKQQRDGREAFEANQENAFATTIWHIRFREDISTANRLIEVSTGKVFDILSTSEVGRKQLLRILTRELQQ